MGLWIRCPELLTLWTPWGRHLFDLLQVLSLLFHQIIPTESLTIRRVHYPGCLSGALMVSTGLAVVLLSSMRRANAIVRNACTFVSGECDT